VLKCLKFDAFEKSRISIEAIIAGEAGIQLFQKVPEPGACPGPDPRFAGATIQETFYRVIKAEMAILPNVHLSPLD